jgi:hypothetical protein
MCAARRACAHAVVPPRARAQGPGRRPIPRRRWDRDGSLEEPRSVRPGGTEGSADVRRGESKRTSDTDWTFTDHREWGSPSFRRSYLSRVGHSRTAPSSRGSLPSVARGTADGSICLGVKGGPQRTVRLNRRRSCRRIIRTACRVAGFGPTTPKQADPLLPRSIRPTRASLPPRRSVPAWLVVGTRQGGLADQLVHHADAWHQFSIAR